MQLSDTNAPTPSYSTPSVVSSPIRPSIEINTTTPTPKEDGDAFDQNKRLGRGVNLGNALEAPVEGEWGVVLQADFFQLIKGAGFNSVRLPIRWSAHAMEHVPYTIDSAFFERVDWAVNQALSRDLVVIINMHHYEEIMVSPRSHKERFLSLWEQIAKHYQDYPDNLFFELLNEPNGSLVTRSWSSIAQEVIQAVRKTNPKRIIIVGPGNWNSINDLYDLQLPSEDRNLIITVHYYSPFNFTHQGAEWVEGSDAWLGTTWQANKAEKEAILNDFNIASKWSQQNHRPIFLGEFGSYNKADMDSRARWTAFIARTAEEFGFSWAYWEFCAGFGLYDRDSKQWNQSLLKALIP